MKKITLLLAMASFLFSCKLMNTEGKADTIYINGKIWTGDTENPWATCIAIKGNKILYVGKEFEGYTSQQTNIIDLHGKLVVPGFTDNHTHFISSGYNLGSVDLRNANTKEEFIKRIKEYAANLPAGRWIVGGNWDHENWGGDLPTHQMIDSVSYDHPIFLSRLDGHMALANSIALQKANVNASTPTPAGGTIVKDATGNPTGVLKDGAMNLVYNVMPNLSNEELDEALLRGQDYALSLGVTQVNDMVSYDGFMDIATWRRAEQNGKLKMRAYQFVPLRSWEKLDSMIKNEGKGDDHIRWGGLKGYADGSLGSTTAWMYQPYLDEPTTSGLMVSDTGWLRKNIIAADAAGLQIAIHAIGDRANDFVLNCYAEAEAKNGERDRRFRIEHAQHLTQWAIENFSKLNVIPSMQAIHAYDDGKWAWKRIDSARISRTYAFRSLLNNKANLTFGSDWDVATLNPIMGIFSAVTRQTGDGKFPNGWVPEQKISVEEALRCYTVNNAYGGFFENKIGQLKNGWLADFVVLSDDLFSIDPNKIKEVKVIRTVIDGKTVYTKK